MGTGASIGAAALGLEEVELPKDGDWVPEAGESMLRLLRGCETGSY